MTGWIAIGVFALMVGWMMWSRRGDVSSEEAHRMVEKGALLLDVRSPGEFAAGHLPGAVNVPVDVLGGRLDKLAKKDRPVVIYCASGMRSAAAARSMRSAGYTQVKNLGAMSRW